MKTLASMKAATLSFDCGPNDWKHSGLIASQHNDHNGMGSSLFCGIGILVSMGVLTE